MRENLWKKLCRNISRDLITARKMMAKKIKHMGMDITENEHKQFHKKYGAHPKLNSRQHKKMMQNAGISETDDKKWHEENDVPSKTNKILQPLNPFAVGGGFLAYCAKQGWVIIDGKGRNSRYYITPEGKKELLKFEIKV